MFSDVARKMVLTPSLILTLVTTYELRWMVHIIGMDRSLMSPKVFGCRERLSTLLDVTDDFAMGLFMASFMSLAKHRSFW